MAHGLFKSQTEQEVCVCVCIVSKKLRVRKTLAVGDYNLTMTSTISSFDHVTLEKDLHI